LRRRLDREDNERMEEHRKKHPESFSHEAEGGAA